MPAKSNLIGIRIGMLTVVSEVGKTKHGHIIWSLKCDCGRICEKSNPEIRMSLRKGARSSCGCLSRVIAKENATSGSEKIRKSKTKHGQALGFGAYASEYHTWKTMRQRCLNPASSDFHDYGARGISVCDKWSDFKEFLEDMGPKPSEKHSLDRINVNGNYEPSNCRWATQTEQARNRRARGTGYRGQLKGAVNHGNFAI